LDNLAISDEMHSLDPIIDSKVLNILPNSDAPQIFAACGRGSRSTLRILRHGLEVEESVSSDLPGIPNAVWTTKRTEQGEYPLFAWKLELMFLQIHMIPTSFSHSLMVPSCCQ
jgi:splicing factor 3B subunit 3